MDVIIFGVDMSSFVHTNNNKKKYFLGEGIAQVKIMCSINFTENNKKFCLSLHYHGANSYLFVNGTEIIKFKAKKF